MSAPQPPPPVTFAPRPVDVDAIERELAQLWHEPAADDDKPQNVTRAVMSNLVVFSSPGEPLLPTPGEIGAIVQKHPSRVLLLLAEPDKTSNDILAQVSAHCHFIGGGRQVLSEHITVTGCGDATRRLPSAARSLLIGDLPTSLWWALPSPPPLGGTLFEELSAMAGQVIYGSLGWRDPVHEMIATADWAAQDTGGQRIADLSWRKLKPWRRIISQGLDPNVVGEAQQTITEIRMEHGPHGLPQAWLLVSWLARRLGWQATGGKVKPGQEITWNFRSPRAHQLKIIIRRLPEGEAVVKKMSISWPAERKTTTVHFEMVEATRWSATWDDPNMAPRNLVWPSETRADLVARQLPDRDPDTLFRNTLQVCKSMAEALL